jgi:hypothetical protein
MEKVVGLSEGSSYVVFPQRNFVVILLSVVLDAAVVITLQLNGCLNAITQLHGEPAGERQTPLVAEKCLLTHFVFIIRLLVPLYFFFCRQWRRRAAFQASVKPVRTSHNIDRRVPTTAECMLVCLFTVTPALILCSISFSAERIQLCCAHSSPYGYTR